MSRQYIEIIVVALNYLIRIFTTYLMEVKHNVIRFSVISNLERKKKLAHQVIAFWQISHKDDDNKLLLISHCYAVAFVKDKILSCKKKQIKKI